MVAALEPSVRKCSAEDEAFLRNVIFSEEDRHHFTTVAWQGGFRWFRSPNITPIEYWRSASPRSTLMPSY
jgi:hypothetical protein